MKNLVMLAFVALLSACGAPNFMGDAPPIQITTTTPDHFELPARIGVARTVYGHLSPASAREAQMWDDLAQQWNAVGSFMPLQTVGMTSNGRTSDAMLAAARAQRFDYLIVMAMTPSTGTADITVVHVGSGGVMVASQATSTGGGQRGFWGGRITNPDRLARVTGRIAQAALPDVEAILQGMVARQR